jgi:3,4-dihydroxy 2-butanone 4-phosphate synthase/GTP cyclohydrolase II
MRSGHTEACVDLCRLAGLPTVGVLSELMNDDGTVMRGPQLAAFANQHKLKSLTIAELISYRQARDKLVERIAEFTVPSEIGELRAFAYVTPFDQVRHMAFILGDIGDGKSVLTRLHRGHMIGDVLGGAKVLRRAMAKIKEEGRGVIVYLQDGAAGVPSTAVPSREDSSESVRTKQWREVGLGAQILKDLGVSTIRLLVSANTTYIGVTGFGIEIESTEHIPKP